MSLQYNLHFYFRRFHWCHRHRVRSHQVFLFFSEAFCVPLLVPSFLIVIIFSFRKSISCQAIWIPCIDFERLLQSLCSFFFVVRKIPYFPTLLVNWSYQVLLSSRNATVKLSSINIIHLKQQYKNGFSIFKLTLKYLLGNVFVHKIHAREFLYIISSFCRGFPHSFNFFAASKGIFHA